jgi:uncharacterized protein (TIGR02117 family)
MRGFGHRLARQATAPMLVLALLAAAAAVWWRAGASPRIVAAPASPADCVDIGVWSNGYHSDIVIPAGIVPAGSPLRRASPPGAFYTVGWGDRNFYQSRSDDPFLGFRAILPGGDAAMHVVPSDRLTSPGYAPRRLIPLAVSHEGAAALVRRLEDAIQLAEDGAPILIGRGNGGPTSRFVAANGDFNLLNVCNHWTARTLRHAGVPVNGAFTFYANQLEKQLAPHSGACAAVRTVALD